MVYLLDRLYCNNAGRNIIWKIYECTSMKSQIFNKTIKFFNKNLKKKTGKQQFRNCLEINKL